MHNRRISTLKHFIHQNDTLASEYIPLISNKSPFYHAVMRDSMSFSQSRLITPFINSSPVFHIRSCLLFASRFSERYLRRWLQSAIFFVERYGHVVLIKHLWVLRVSRCGHRLSANSRNFWLYVCAHMHFMFPDMLRPDVRELIRSIPITFALYKQLCRHTGNICLRN